MRRIKRPNPDASQNIDLKQIAMVSRLT